VRTNYTIRKLHTRLFLFIAILGCTLFAGNAYSQAEVEPWGNISGIRKHGQLYEFESSLRVLSKDGMHIASTGKEKQQPRYSRKDKNQTVLTRIDSLYFSQTVTDLSAGKIKVAIQVVAKKDTAIKGVFFCITLPAKEYEGSKLKLSGVAEDPLMQTTPLLGNSYVNVRAKGAVLSSQSRQLKITFDKPELIIVKKDTAKGNNNIQIYVPLKLDGVHAGDTVSRWFTIQASGDVDDMPVNLGIDTTKQGRAFAGLGGNFRLQNAKTDPQVIDYSLKNLRVAWGRVEMPWRFWQPEKDGNPTLDANSGKLHPAVQKAMDMARRLDSLGMPVILSAWSAPKWAIVGPPNYRPTPEGIWGNPLEPAAMDAIYKSITDYILLLKNKYGFEVKLFSFNESDLGINIRMTGQEHANFIKGLGAYMASKGLKTKMLLGDNSDATTYSFIYPAMADADALPYVGAVSFHSWRGWEKETLDKWAEAATKLNLPLIVGEGSIDAAAWNYPDIFQEQTYALQEINLYMRLLAICQPVSILQWQLTADYSPLIGGGIFNNDEPLHPGQRFWNLKQLSITPKDLYAMPLTCNRPGISAAALGDNSKGKYAIHLVNNGTTRKVTLTGLPQRVSALKVYVTTKKLTMKQEIIKVTNGQAVFKLPTTSYATLINE